MGATSCEAQDSLLYCGKRDLSNDFGRDKKSIKTNLSQNYYMYRIIILHVE